jgi:hypothetical protein
MGPGPDKESLPYRPGGGPADARPAPPPARAAPARGGGEGGEGFACYPPAVPARHSMKVNRGMDPVRRTFVFAPAFE